MDDEKVAIRIVPTPATQNLTGEQLETMSRVTKLSPAQVRERFSQGKNVVIVTAPSPKIKGLVEMIKAIGFHVTTGPVSKGSRDRKKSPGSPTKDDAMVKRSRSKFEAEWQVGDIIENLYEVRDIKHGGMGAVYIARHMRWNTMLAVKSLHSRLRKNEEDRALFVKEAETWIDIGFHPNIAACFYVRNIRDSPRIFIEYVDAGALNYWLIRRRSVGWDLILDLMVQFCYGLEHAHSMGLVHRDIKPGNCMMTRDGLLKITDFGLTKRRGQERGRASSEDMVVQDRESVTAAGMGTPGYMAPEMWAIDSEVGPEADIYAFGVMLFEICCGRKPFSAKGSDRHKRLAIAHIRKAPPSPSSYRKDIPESMEQIILKCLSKAPGDRYPSARELREDLVTAYEIVCMQHYPRESPDAVKLLSDALNNRALSLIDLDHQEEATRTLEKALESDPHHPEAVYNLGLMQWLRTRNPSWELVVKMEEVVKTNEYRARGAHLLGRCLLTLGDASRALDACEISLAGEDAGEQWLKSYAIALIGMRRDADAIEYLEKYLTEFPNDTEALGWLTGALVRTEQMNTARAQIKALHQSSPFAGLEPDEIADAYVFSGLTEELLLEGHNGWITCAAQFPKSELLITCARDRTIKIWNSRNGEIVKTIALVGAPPSSLAISPDERIAAVWAEQKGAPVMILNLESDRFVGNLSAEEGQVTAVAFFPDNKTIMTVQDSGTVRIWDTEELKSRTKFKRIPAHSAAAVIFDSSSRPEVIVAGMDRMVKRVDPVGSEVTAFEKGHAESIIALKASPDGRRVLTAGRDKRAIVWDRRKGKIVTDFQVHEEQIGHIDLNPRRRIAATYDPKAGTKVWDERTGMVIRSFFPGKAEIDCLKFSPDGERLLSGGKDLVLKVWDVRGRALIPEPALAKVRAVTKQMKSEQEFKAGLAAAKKATAQDAYAEAYSLIRKAQSLSGYERSDLALDIIQRISEHGKRVGLSGGWKRKTFETSSSVRDVSFSPSAINFLTAHSDHSVRMWSSNSGECLKTLEGHTNLVASVSFSPSGREAVSAGDDRSIRIWDLHSGRTTAVLKGHSDSVGAVVYSAAGDLILSGSWDKTIRLWRVSDSTPVRTIKGHEDEITSVDFAGTSDLILSAGFLGSVKMWDLNSGRQLRNLKAHEDRISCLRTSPNGDMFLTGANDGTVRLWDLKRFAPVRSLEGHEAGVRAATFSPDQMFILTGGEDSVLKLWGLETGECLREFQGHAKAISAVEFSANGRFVISASTDGVAMIWELDWDWEFEDLVK